MTSQVGVEADGRVLGGRYRLLSRIADGGMATVYLAFDERLGRRVAVKLMRPDLARDEAFVARFRREAQVAAGLSHGHIVAVHDFEESDGQLWLVMELVEGQTLRQRISADGAMSVRAAVATFADILAALAEAHRAGLVHRDVKPENVLVRDDGTIKVTDFGLARAVTSSTRTSTTGVLLGTVSYLAPEQLDGDRADARSDVYAAGLILYELLTGQKAFQGDNPMHVAYQHVHGSVPLASDRVATVPLELDRLIGAASARDPADRPADAGALLALLRETTRQLSDEELDAVPRFLAGMPPTPLVPAATGATASTATSDDVEDRSSSPGDTAVLATVAPTTALPLLTPPTEPNAVLTVLGEPATTETTASTASTPATSMTTVRRGRRRWPWVLALLLLVGGAGGWLWWDSFGPGSVRLVPTLAHQPLADAQRVLAGLDLKAAPTEAYSETEPSGQVIASEPGAGAQVHKNTSVALQVSKGPERYGVPALTGVPRADVERLLAERHLVLGAVTEAFDETVPAGTVVSQDQPPETSVKPGTAVAIVVSKGRQPIPVPNLAGKGADEAQKQLEGLGLKVVRGAAVNSDTVPEGAIVSQNPNQGTLFKGDTVTIVVSKGPVLVQVPNVVGMQRAKAVKTLEDLGFKVAFSNVLGGFFNTVRASDPGAGSMARKGSTVTLTIV